MKAVGVSFIFITLLTSGCGVQKTLSSNAANRGLNLCGEETRTCANGNKITASGPYCLFDEGACGDTTVSEWDIDDLNGTDPVTGIPTDPGKLRDCSAVYPCTETTKITCTYKKNLSSFTGTETYLAKINFLVTATAGNNVDGYTVGVLVESATNSAFAEKFNKSGNPTKTPLKVAATSTSKLSGAFRMTGTYETLAKQNGDTDYTEKFTFNPVSGTTLPSAVIEIGNATDTTIYRTADDSQGYSAWCVKEEPTL